MARAFRHSHNPEIKTMVNLASKKIGDVLLLANAVVFVVLLNTLSGYFYLRVDLTEEKRFTIKQQTKDILNTLDDEINIDVYLQGDLNPGFERFRKAILETLEEFRVQSGNKVHYTFVDPAMASGQQAQSEFMAELAAKGIQPTNVIENRNGQRVEKLIFPGAVISYGSAETGVMLLKGNKARTPDEEINQSIEGIEYELINAIYKLVTIDHKRVGLSVGHGELDSVDIAALHSALLELYDVLPVEVGHDDLAGFDVVIVPKPRYTFSPVDKYKLDQYIMNGGSVLFLLDRLEATMDSASAENYFAFPYNTGLDDQLFKYGVRINPDLIQDLSSSRYPVITGDAGGKPQMQLMDWPFFPLINRFADHPATRNLDAVILKFASSIDTVKAQGIRKTPLMFTSQYSRTIETPVRVNVNDIRRNPGREEFVKSFVPLGYLLEGKFSSLFKNRFLPEGIEKTTFRDEGEPSKIIVIADGDLAANVVNLRTGQPQPLGFDPFTKYTFANRDLLLNAVAYLADENGLINTRNKEVKIRPLDREKVNDEKVKWQIINVALPVLIVILYGILRSYLRRRSFSRF